MKRNITFSQNNCSLLPENDVPQELFKVIVKDDEIVKSDEGPNPIVMNDEDEAPYHSFVQDTSNDPLELDRLYRAFAWPGA